MGPRHSWETEAGKVEAACPRPRYELAQDWDSHLCGSHLNRMAVQSCQAFRGASSASTQP